MDTKYTPGQTCDNCRTLYPDRQRGIYLCNKHAATDDLLEALEAMTEWADSVTLGSERKQHAMSWALAVMAKARGE